jgi:hypothetical protein
MKKLTALLSIMLFSGGISWSQCNDYYDFKEGTTWEFVNYNAKGKLLGKSSQVVTGYETTSDGYRATVEVVSEDKKGEKIGPMELTWECKNGVMLFDMKKFFPQEQMAEMEDMEISVSGENLEFPSGLSIGDDLEDAEVVMTMGSEGMGLHMTVNITNRFVEGKESVTTESGTYDCLKISSTITTKMIIKIEMQSIEWVAPGVGLVRSESFRKGKLTGYTELTAHSR